jgi:hypothetical protein
MLCERTDFGKGTRTAVLVQFPINHVYQVFQVFRLSLDYVLEIVSGNGDSARLRLQIATLSPVSNALVLRTCSARDNWRPERLFYRRLAWDRYRIIANPDHLMSQESPFLHSSKPLLAYVSTQHQFSLDEEGIESHSGNWHGLHIVNLENGLETQFASEESITLPPGTERGWICEILSFGDSGLSVKAALSKNEAAFEYFVAELDATQNVKPIAALPAVFM